MADRDALTPACPGSRPLHHAWMLTGVELYLAATDGCGWTDTDNAR